MGCRSSSRMRSAGVHRLGWAFLEIGREMTEIWGRVADAQATQRLALFVDLDHALGHIAKVCAGVDAARNRKPHELERRRALDAGRRIGVPEHERADLDRADAEI